MICWWLIFSRFASCIIWLIPIDPGRGKCSCSLCSIYVHCKRLKFFYGSKWGEWGKNIIGAQIPFLKPNWYPPGELFYGWLYAYKAFLLYNDKKPDFNFSGKDTLQDNIFHNFYQPLAESFRFLLFKLLWRMVWCGMIFCLIEHFEHFHKAVVIQSLERESVIILGL